MKAKIEKPKESKSRAVANTSVANAKQAREVTDKRITQQKPIIQLNRATIQLVSYSSPTIVKDQKGKFVGDPKKVHIHIVKDETHIKLGGIRKDFNEDNKDEVKTIYNWLGGESKWNGISGFDDCLNWLLKTYTKLNKKEVEEEKEEKK
jgi:hypothetical protein